MVDNRMGKPGTVFSVMPIRPLPEERNRFIGFQALNEESLIVRIRKNAMPDIACRVKPEIRDVGGPFITLPIKLVGLENIRPAKGPISFVRFNHFLLFP